MTKKQEDKFLAEFTEGIFGDDLDEALVEAIFEKISKIDGIERLFVNQIRRDRVKFFNASTEIQERIKGQAIRSLTILKKIRSKKDGKTTASKARESFNDKGGHST